MTDSQRLLVQYARTRSESAFGELVSRYMNLVYSSALRLVDGDRHLVEDVAQQVFADLAAKAGSLSSEVMLGGWLHRRTCFVAGSLMRKERRRRARERRSAEITSMEDHSETNLAGLKALLDEAINELRAEERVPILLRFFEQRDFRAIAQALGTTEEAAQKRVSRALDKLAVLLTRRGFAASSAVLATVLAGEAVTAAPAGFAAVVAAAPAVTAQGLSWLKLLSAGKLKLALGAAAIIGMAAIPVTLQHQNAEKLREENRVLKGQLEQLSTLSAENGHLSALLPQAPQQLTDTLPSSELLRLRGEVGRLRLEKQEWDQTRQRLQAQASASMLRSNNSGSPAPLPLFRRNIKIDPQPIYEKLKQTYPEQDLSSADAVIKAFRWLLETNNINLQPPESVFLNDRKGELVVYSSMTNLDAIELLISKVNAGL